jgi:ribosomal protein S18 acetylase RimI-like enzyme
MEGIKMDVLIRKYKDSDKNEIISLMPRFADIKLPEWRKPEDISKKTENLINEAVINLTEDKEILVAFTDNIVLGFVLLHTRKDFFTDESHGYISEIAVRKEFEGQGIGRLLLKASEKWSKEKGYRLLGLHALIGNKRGQRVYEEFGFEKESIQYTKIVN